MTRKKIITITVNSAIDNEIEVENFKIGKNVRAVKEAYYPSGKGINVARTISLLQQEVISIAFTGKSSKDLFDSINSAYLKTINIITENATRNNISLIDRKKGLVACIHKDGPELSKKEISLLYKTVEGVVDNGDIVIISGSLPKNSDPQIYYKLIVRCKKKGARVIFDSYGKWLVSGINANPFLIKPNISEFQLLAGTTFDDDQAIVEYAQDNLRTYNIPIVIISLGAKGILLIDYSTRSAYKAWIKSSNTLKTSVGSGDAFVGGFAVSLMNEEKIQDAIRLAVACGAVNQSTEGPGVISLNKVKQLTKKVEIRAFK